MMSREQFANTGWIMTYEQYQRCCCSECDLKAECIHRDAYRRIPFVDGGMEMCPRLKGSRYKACVNADDGTDAVTVYVFDNEKGKKITPPEDISAMVLSVLGEYKDYARIQDYLQDIVDGEDPEWLRS